MNTTRTDSIAISPEASDASNKWASYIERLIPLGDAMADQLTEPQDPQLRQELFDLIYSQIAQGYMGLVYADPKYPSFYPFINLAFNMLTPNPDNTYFCTPLDEHGIYKISGFRGSVRIVDFLITAGTMYTCGEGGMPELGPGLVTHDLDRGVHIKEDGSFELVLSAERPDGYEGDWWKLPAKSTFILGRQISCDWLNEVDGRFAIERLDLPAIRPRPTADEIAAKLRAISKWTEEWTKILFAFMASVRKAGPVNQMRMRENTKDEGGTPNQRNMSGYFKLDSDEALILETELPERCRYWNVETSDDIKRMIDPVNRQTSLNNHTVKIDADGKIRIVICEQDPGVPNWLDTAGYRDFYMVSRFYECSSYPIPNMQKIKMADVRKYVHADTPEITAEARDAAIRLRRKGAQLRRQW